MSSIHDFGFRAYDGELTSPVARTLAITTSEIRRTFKSKRFLVFFILCLGPVLIAFVFVWIRFLVLEGQGELAGFGGSSSRQWARDTGPFGRQLSGVDFYFDILRGGSTLLTVLYSAVVGAGIIARDRAAGALEIYFTRGIAPWQYFVGKMLSVFFLLLCQVLFGFLVVWIFAVSVAPADLEYFDKTWPFIPRLIAGQGLLCLTLAFWLTALSTSTDSSRFAILRWVGVLAALRILGGLLRRFFQDGDWMLVSPYQVIRRIAAEVVGATPSSMSIGWAVLVWALLCGAALLWTKRHLRPVEVVG